MPPNPLGIYGLQDNAAEWVNDWYDPEYYSYSPVKNPQGPENAVQVKKEYQPLQAYRVLRGNWAIEVNSNVLIRRESEAKDKPQYSPWTGFRCAIQSTKKL